MVSDSENCRVGTTFWHSPAYKLSPLNSSGHRCEDNSKTRGQHASEITNKERLWFRGGVPHQTAPGIYLFPHPTPRPSRTAQLESLASTGKDGWKARGLRMTP